MLKKSYGSVQVTWLDRPAVLAAVISSVHQLAGRKPEVQKVILFGSMARGDAVPGSDVDLLVVLTESGQPFLERISQYLVSGVPVGVDVFPYTEHELAGMLEDGNPFIRQALNEGITLYERVKPNTPSPDSLQ